MKRSFETLAEAKAFRAGAPIIEEKQESVCATPLAALIDSMTFGELVERWKQNWLPSRNIATQIRYKQYLKYFEILWNIKMTDIQSDQIDLWIAHVKKPEYLKHCHSTRCNYENEYMVLKGILTYYATRCNRDYRLPFLKDHRKMLKVKDKTLIKKDLTVDQFKAFMAELRKLCWGNRWEVIYYLAATQYAIYGRVQDAAALYVEDFDLANDRLEIKRKVQWLRTKGYEDKIVLGSKSNGGKVFSPIPQLAIQVLNEWMMRSGTRKGPLFLMGGEIIRYRQIQFKYDQALKNAGLPFRSTHILRHATLVEAYSSCANILTVQKLAGHSGLRATEKYAKVRDTQVADTQRLMDKKLALIW